MYFAWSSSNEYLLYVFDDRRNRTWEIGLKFNGKVSESIEVDLSEPIDLTKDINKPLEGILNDCGRFPISNVAKSEMSPEVAMDYIKGRLNSKRIEYNKQKILVHKIIVQPRQVNLRHAS